MNSFVNWRFTLVSVVYNGSGGDTRYERIDDMVERESSGLHLRNVVESCASARSCLFAFASLMTWSRICRRSSAGSARSGKTGLIFRASLNRRYIPIGINEMQRIVINKAGQGNSSVAKFIEYIMDVCYKAMLNFISLLDLLIYSLRTA